MPQPREAADYFGEDERCTVAILDAGGVDHSKNQVTVCVGQDVPLAPLDFLARIVAQRPAALGGFDTLAVDHSCTGRRFASYDRIDFLLTWNADGPYEAARA